MRAQTTTAALVPITRRSTTTMPARPRRRTRAALCLLAAATIAGPLAFDGPSAAADPAPAGTPARAWASVRDLAGATFFSLRAGDRPRFAALRSQLSATVALELGVSTFRLHAAWALADDRRMAALLAALGQLGTPYRSHHSEPGVGFDCSGLTSWAWAQAGVPLPHQSGSQIQTIPPTDLTHVAPADIVWYPGHVMMSLGLDGAVVDASDHATDVRMMVVKPERFARYKIGSPIGP
jgi:hypothetical protein